MRSAIIFLLLQVAAGNAAWQYSDIDQVLARRGAVQLGPRACMKAVKAELTEALAANNSSGQLSAKIADLQLFVSLEELTREESCGQRGSTIMRDNELKLEGRQWLARIKWNDREPTQRVLVHFANQHAELCQPHYLRTFEANWAKLEQATRDQVEALTTPLIDAFTPVMADPEQQRLVGQVRSWTVERTNLTQRALYNRKAVGFQSVNTEDAADIMRQVVIRLASSDPRVACLEVGARARIRQTIGRLSGRYECNLAQILDHYVYQPCRAYLAALSDPLEYLSYDLLLSKQVLSSQDERVLDMHLAAGRARICHLLSEHDHQRFLFNLLRMTGNLPLYYYLAG